MNESPEVEPASVGQGSDEFKTPEGVKPARGVIWATARRLPLMRLEWPDGSICLPCWAALFALWLVAFVGLNWWVLSRVLP